jgi:hypothetical protein
MSQQISVNDVLDKKLKALKDVKVQTAPASDGGKVIGYLRKGMVSPPVWSYIRRGDKIYWVFDYSIPGGPQGSYVVLHEPGRFKLLEPFAVTQYKIDLIKKGGSVAPDYGGIPGTESDAPGFFDDIKKVAMYGAFGLAALLLITRNK